MGTLIWVNIGSSNGLLPDDYLTYVDLSSQVICDIHLSFLLISDNQASEILNPGVKVNHNI